MRPATSTLFIACTLIWGTTWYAITFQLGAVAQEVGVALVFWPELAQLSADSSSALGAALTAAAVLLSCIANMVVIGQQRRHNRHREN